MVVWKRNKESSLLLPKLLALGCIILKGTKAVRQIRSIYIYIYIYVSRCTRSSNLYREFITLVVSLTGQCEGSVFLVKIFTFNSMRKVICLSASVTEGGATLGILQWHVTSSCYAFLFIYSFIYLFLYHGLAPVDNLVHGSDDL